MSLLEIVVIGLFCVAGYLIFKTVIDVWSQDKNRTTQERTVAAEPSGTKDATKKSQHRILFLAVVPCSYLVLSLVVSYLTLFYIHPVTSDFGAALVFLGILVLCIAGAIGYYIIYAIIGSFSRKNSPIYNIILVSFLFIFALLMPLVIG